VPGLQKTGHVDDPVQAGKRLREARERAGLSQAALAAVCGCSGAYISRLEVGDRTPSLQLLRRIGRRLGVSADYLATGAVTTEAESSALFDAELALRLNDLDRARGLYDEALVGAVTEAERARALAGLGQVALSEGKPRDAVAYLEAAVAAGGLDPVEQPAIAESLARAYAAAGELSPSIALLERCVGAYETSPDVLQYIRFASMLGYALTDNGDLAGAERVVAKALSAGRDVAEPYARARLYWSQSRLLAEQGQPAAAERYARKTLETLRATEDNYAIAHAIETLAHICLDLGRADDALELLEEGDSLIEAAGTAAEIAHYRLERARALAALGNREDAASLAMSVAGQLGDVQPVSRGRAYYLLAELFRDLGEPARAKELYELAIACAEEQAPSKHLVAAYRALAELLKAEGRRDEALDLLERALNAQVAAGIRA
jgi:transcriptional regulator with XRE-family HTH domain